MSDKKRDPFGNIWITSRIRMDAHAKFTRLDRLSHITLTFYSVALLGFSVFQSHLTNTPLGPYVSEISIVLSASILCASLVVWGLGFGALARDHRDCYLALQRLYDAEMNEQDKKSAYQDVLTKHPNHSDLDYERFIFRKLWIEHALLETPRGPVTMGCLRAAKYLVKEIIAWTFGLTLVSSPAIIIAAFYAI
ncbi:SLATT domain-containing protein [Epibacterium sp. MM17-32]|uniref:SLATT domain-containing protein n=1 Tax=Epibacterium sp. MM17-32 TaxID=2917734 RepID=UPI001EF4ED8E|nr:SLATT domain-containing protein [Epibacterium sp. MM17-32]MCG7630529.1 SLATT domain-containing protein [Epibacterium sp. MM17-32]